MEPREFWQKIESLLLNYAQVYSPHRWFRGWGGLTKDREGYYIFLRFVFLVSLYAMAFSLPLSPWARLFPAIIAIYLIADMVFLPTAIFFGGMLPIHLRISLFRPLVFVFSTYISIAIAFGVLYVTLCRSSFNIVPNFIDLAYFSFTTMTALGLGDITPARNTLLVRFLIVSEVLIGLYFWAVLVGTLIAWNVGKNKSSFPGKRPRSDRVAAPEVGD